MALTRKTIVLGFDGLEPRILERMLAQGRLPNFAKLRDAGAYARVATTTPAQTPVAWSSFATGVNPGRHGIFDFLSRDPERLLPIPALTRYEQKNPFLPPKASNLRRAPALWEHLTEKGLESAVLRCPCTYPPDRLKGRLLAGVGVPDLRGSFGIPTFYTSAPGAKSGESENLVRLPDGHGGSFETHLPGPLNPKTREPAQFPLHVEVRAGEGRLLIHSSGQPETLTLEAGQWSGWLKAKFKLSLLQSVRGMARFHLARLLPRLEFYASPVNFDPAAAAFPISTPETYARELETRLGTYHTTGLAEDHTGLLNGRLSEAAFLAQCETVWREREAMLFHELGRFRAGLLFCLFDTPDRIQHMFWRFGEPDHPAHAACGGAGGAFAHVIEECYARCDAVLGRVLEQAGEALLMVLSDHGFGSFRRGVQLNTWLLDQGLLALKPGLAPGEGCEALLQSIDWTRTKAYALGLSGIYLNLAGREAQGLLKPGEAAGIQAQIARTLPELRDPSGGARPVRAVRAREAVYTGPFVREAPDLLVQFAQGYRFAWAAALGGLGAGHFEDNTRRWSGDHVVDPALVPGVLLMNRPFRAEGARLLDLAPTILQALGVPASEALEGRPLL